MEKVEKLEIKTIKELMKFMSYDELCSIINEASELRKEMCKPVLIKRMRAVLKCWFRNFPYMNCSSGCLNGTTSKNYLCKDVIIYFLNEDHSLCKFTVYLSKISQTQNEEENIVLKFEYNGVRIYQFDCSLVLPPYYLRRLFLGVYDIITFFASYQTDEQIEEWYNQNKDTLKFGQFPK